MLEGRRDSASLTIRSITCCSLIDVVSISSESTGLASGPTARLESRSSQYDRPLIAPFGDEARMLRADPLLFLHKLFPHRWKGSNVRRSAGDFASAQQVCDGFAVQQDGGGLLVPVELNAAVLGDERDLAGIVQVCLAACDFESDRTIHRAGVEEIKPEPLGDTPGDGAFAGAGGAVDRNDHNCSDSSGNAAGNHEVVFAERPAKI
jgi:hypothetical protein